MEHSSFWYNLAKQTEDQDFGAHILIEDHFPLSQIRNHTLNSLLEFKPAGIGQGQKYQIAENIRQDKIIWIDQLQESSSQILQKFLQQGQKFLSEYFRIRLTDYEGHMAYYSNGAGYAPHYDTFKHDQKRIFSFLLYFNSDWQPGDGGELVIHQSDKNIIIEPTFGQAVLFKSSIILHEVKPAHQPRLSLACWFRHG